MKLRKHFIVCLFFLFCFFYPVIKIQAAGEFTADYDVDYSVNQNGLTIVTEKITLTNNVSNIYPKTYSIVFDTDKIQNVVAFSDIGKINTQVIKNDGKTQITLAFDEHIVGIGKKLPFTLRFENLDIAQKIGSIWEVNVPGISDNRDLGNYIVSLQTPTDFGPNAYMVPEPKLGRKWTKEQMISGGISAAYGKEQYFSAQLLYYLENATNISKLTEIALPPDTAYQKVSIQSLEPKPQDVVRDPDGNWMGRYEIPPQGKIEIHANVIVSISVKPRTDYYSDPIIESEYVKATKNWNSLYPTIVSLGQLYTTPQQIYDYVIKTLTYNYDLINQNPTRKGAVEALNNPKEAVCMEFTDLFIAIARASGIPARQNVGFAYTTNTKLRPLSMVTDILHAWPEYYDREQKIWVPVDPTWSSTTGGIDYFHKLDFNHIVFAINGLQDDYPYPAGSYRSETHEGKIVDVRFANPDFARHIPGKLVTSIKFPAHIIAGLNTYGTVTIANTTGVGINGTTLTVVSEPTNLRIQKILEHIPPYTTIKIPIDFKTNSIFAYGKGKIITKTNTETITYSFQIQPLYAIIVLLTCILMILIFFIWKILKRYQKQKILF